MMQKSDGPPSRTTVLLRALRALATAAAFGVLASAAFLDVLSRISGSEFIYVTASSRLAILALVPLVIAIVTSLLLALAGRVGRRRESVEVRVLIILDMALIAAVASIATRDNSEFLREEPARWPALLLGLVAAALAGLGATSLILQGRDRSSAVRLESVDRPDLDEEGAVVSDTVDA